MFSVSPAEIVTIAVVVLLVFGPQRLPEITRKVGKVMREVTKAANELKAGIEREFDDAAGPLKEVRRQLGTTVQDPPPKPRPVQDPKPVSASGPGEAHREPTPKPEPVQDPVPESDTEEVE